MNAQIEGRVAVVTGGSSGIGFETLRLLLASAACPSPFCTPRWS